MDHNNYGKGNDATHGERVAAPADEIGDALSAYVHNLVDRLLGAGISWLTILDYAVEVVERLAGGSLICLFHLVIIHEIEWRIFYGIASKFRDDGRGRRGILCQNNNNNMNDHHHNDNHAGHEVPGGAHDPIDEFDDIPMDHYCHDFVQELLDSGADWGAMVEQTVEAIENLPEGSPEWEFQKEIYRDMEWRVTEGAKEPRDQGDGQVICAADTGFDKDFLVIPTLHDVPDAFSHLASLPHRVRTSIATNFHYFCKKPAHELVDTLARGLSEDEIYEAADRL
ncbi:hypothetical protein QBC38DRAFT_461304 [Podospora fimiseda]|uniref:Uncharacterized protein n=1 Tax=Podospora fimiseda TaxID=252190 RepID=A0AAN7BFH7_9PEZI|nr:hypothetical protein QBC38DRAFT_461304 [Podospora fimiseda]